jgi:hypothetical protein
MQVQQSSPFHNNTNKLTRRKSFVNSLKSLSNLAKKSPSVKLATPPLTYQSSQSSKESLSSMSSGEEDQAPRILSRAKSPVSPKAPQNHTSYLDIQSEPKVHNRFLHGGSSYTPPTKIPHSGVRKTSTVDTVTQPHSLLSVDVPKPILRKTSLVVRVAPNAEPIAPKRQNCAMKNKLPVVKIDSSPVIKTILRKPSAVEPPREVLSDGYSLAPVRSDVGMKTSAPIQATAIATFGTVNKRGIFLKVSMDDQIVYFWIAFDELLDWSRVQERIMKKYQHVGYSLTYCRCDDGRELRITTKRDWERCLNDMQMLKVIPIVLSGK